MKLLVHKRLEKLYNQAGMEYGKLVQKLLAIAFCTAGARQVIERATQGIDLEIELPDGRKIAVEVKTTNKRSLVLSPKDLAGLATQIKAEREPYFAVLGSQMTDKLMFVRYIEGEIKANNKYPLSSFATFRDDSLERWIENDFDNAVCNYSNLSEDNPQTALNKILENFECHDSA